MGELIRNALKALREREQAETRRQDACKAKPVMTAEQLSWETSAKDALRVNTMTRYY